MNKPVSVYNEFIDSKWLYGVVVYGLGCRGLHSPTGRLQLPDLNLSGVLLLEQDRAEVHAAPGDSTLQVDDQF